MYVKLAIYGVTKISPVMFSHIKAGDYWVSWPTASPHGAQITIKVGAKPYLADSEAGTQHHWSLPPLCSDHIQKLRYVYIRLSKLWKRLFQPSRLLAHETLCSFGIWQAVSSHYNLHRQVLSLSIYIYIHITHTSLHGTSHFFNIAFTPLRAIVYTRGHLLQLLSSRSTVCVHVQ